MIDCPKCGCATVNKRYKDEKDVVRCACPICEYKWDQTPLDRLSPEERAQIEGTTPSSSPHASGLWLLIASVLLVVGFGLFFALQ